jgi:hypothetical protein
VRESEGGGWRKGGTGVKDCWQKDERKDESEAAKKIRERGGWRERAREEGREHMAYKNWFRRCRRDASGGLSVHINPVFLKIESRLIELTCASADNVARFPTFY